MATDERTLFSEGMLKEPRDVCGVLFRPLQHGDFVRGFCDVLGELTTCGTTREQFSLRFGELEKEAPTHFVIVGEDHATGRIVATGSVFIERKFIHECGRVGHVEDIVVAASARGRHLGEALMAQLAHVARSAGCYKVILNCSEQARGFYEKCGYHAKEVEMVMYF